MAAAKQKQVPEWTAKDAAPLIRIPSPGDDKYSHGVLGMVTGSKRYPGAAILGVEAAHHMGIGMVRYLGPRGVSKLVLVRRPEIVIVDGRVNAWLIGSGIDAEHRTWREKCLMLRALRSGLPVVVDAGALDLVNEATRSTVITPHARELAWLLTRKKASRALEQPNIGALAEEIAKHPADWVEYAADHLKTVVLLKGYVTHVAEPASPTAGRFHVKITSPTTWLATAGSGDVLAGILGALLATNSMQPSEQSRRNAQTLQARIAATAAFIHAYAAGKTSAGRPIAALDITKALSDTSINCGHI